MGKEDWYRRTTWTPRDQELFFGRLRRSRSDLAKAQYLRIQALYLQQEASPPLYEEALKLLELFFRECPHPADLGSAYLQKAQCLEALGDLDGSLRAFRDALRADRAGSGVRTNAPLEFAVFAVRHGRNDLYDEVLNGLEGAESHLLFPATEYKLGMVLAIIAWETGELEEARKHAQIALKAAQKEHSGLRYHPTVGLVERVDEGLHHRLLKIAGA